MVVGVITPAKIPGVMSPWCHRGSSEAYGCQFRFSGCPTDVPDAQGTPAAEIQRRARHDGGVIGDENPATEPGMMEGSGMTV